LNRQKLYDMFDDLYIDIGTPPFNVWKKELECRGVRVEILVPTNTDDRANMGKFAVSRLCDVMGKNPGHVILPNPVDPKMGVSVILVPEKLASNMLVLGHNMSRSYP